jgi:catechol 2,3-dioxygenase-like lactoylglutathione lyase family enzyme
MILMPIVFVTDMERSIAFYESLGFAPQSRSPMWTELTAGERAILALHHAEAPPEPSERVQLGLVSEEPLEHVEERFGNALARPIADEAFGRSLILRDPDGLEIQVNEHDPSLYAAGR